MLEKIIEFIKRLLGILSTEESTAKEEKLYSQKSLMTATEKDFYNKLAPLETHYRIIPQLNLATIIKKETNSYMNELFRNIDFAIFDPNYEKVLLLIELNDSTHNQKKRKSRDIKVKTICNSAHIKLITFYTKYPNEQSYVIKRILDEINKENIIIQAKEEA